MKDIPRDYLELVAYCRANGVPHSVIAHKLGQSERTAYRWAEDAKREGLLEEALTCKNILPQRLRELEEWAAGLDITKKLQGSSGNRVLRHVHVVDSGSKRRSVRDWKNRQIRFGRLAARHVSDLLLRRYHPKSIAVAWGETVDATLQGFRDRHSSPPLQRSAVTVHPVRGDVMGTITDARCSSSILAATLSELIQGKSGVVDSLAGVPAVVPHTFRHKKALREFAQLSRPFSTLFGGSRRISEMDCVLTSVGAREEKFGTWTQRSITTWGVRKDWFERRILGDVAGVFIPTDSVYEKEVRARNEEDWMGIELSDFQDCAKRGMTDNCPGVVVVALGGRSKAEVIYRCCVDYAMINELVIDQVLFKELVNLVN